MNDLPQLSGPSVEPATGVAPAKLVIFCHGVGADGNDLINLAPYFQKILPDARFLSPNAPEPFDMAPPGFGDAYQWFSLGDMSPENRLAGAQKAAPILDAFIDQQLNAAGLRPKDLVLIGFSQGTMVSLHTALRRAEPIAGIIGYSGMLVGEDLLETELKSRPPVMLCHGEVDDILPFDAMAHAEQHLRAAGLRVESLSRPGLGHGLDDQCILAGMHFLADIFNIDVEKLAGGGLA